MRYIVADIDRASDIGIEIKGHLINGRLIIFNEKELLTTSCIEGDLNERADSVSGIIYTNSEINQLINKGGWKNGL